MKIPKTFVKENISDEDLKKILDLKEDKLFNKHMDRLVSSCDQFLGQAYGSTGIKYEIGEEIASKYFYTLEDVENLSKRVLLEALPLWPSLPSYNVENLGFYFSALVNKIIKENDVVNLTMGMKLSGIGSHLPKGKLVSYGDVGSWTGNEMSGGNLIILGHAGDYTCCDMINGVVIVNGKVGGLLGYQARGGEIYVEDVESMIAMSCKATVYKKGEKIWYGKGIID